MSQARSKAGFGLGGKVSGGIGGWGRFGRFASRRLEHDLFEAFEENLTAFPEGHIIEVAVAIEHAVGQFRFMGQGGEHSVFDGIFGHQIDHGDGTRLMLAPSASYALFEFGRVPGKIAIDHDAGVLKVESHSSGIGAEKDAAIGVLPECEDFRAAFLLGHQAGVPGITVALFFGQFPNPFKHADPFGKYDDFNLWVGKAFFEHGFQFLEFGAVPVWIVFDNAGGVADHTHHSEQNHELLLLLRSERDAFRFLGQPCHDFIVIRILLPHGFGQRNKEIAVGSVGQLGFNICLAPTEHYRRHLGPELTQVLVSLGTPPVVQMVILPIEPEEGAEECGIEEIDDGPDLVYAVFQRGPGENEGESALQTLDCLSRFTRPIFYALGFIQDDDVGPQIGIYVEAVAKYLFVVADGKEGRFRVLVECHSLSGASVDQPLGKRTEFTNLLFPFRLERCR